LGCIISLSYDNNTKEKLQAFQVMCGKVNKRSKTRKDKKIKFYEVMATSFFLYGCEIWVTTQRDKEIQASEMKFLGK
jgi:hypothetical protein